MKPGGVKIIDRISAVEAIMRLNEEDLLFDSSSYPRQKAPRFTKGDRVGFQASDGRMLEGIVLRLNKKAVSVAANDGHQWNMAPGLLRLVQSAGEQPWP